MRRPGGQRGSPVEKLTLAERRGFFWHVKCSPTGERARPSARPLAFFDFRFGFGTFVFTAELTRTLVRYQDYPRQLRRETARRINLFRYVFSSFFCKTPDDNPFDLNVTPVEQADAYL